MRQALEHDEHQRQAVEGVVVLRLLSRRRSRGGGRLRSGAAGDFSAGGDAAAGVAVAGTALATSGAAARPAAAPFSGAGTGAAATGSADTSVAAGVSARGSLSLLSKLWGNQLHLVLSDLPLHRSVHGPHDRRHRPAEHAGDLTGHPERSSGPGRRQRKLLEDRRHHPRGTRHRHRGHGPVESLNCRTAEPVELPEPMNGGATNVPVHLGPSVK